MEKVFQVTKQAREDMKTLQSYMTDLQNWETEMKRKEAALSGVLDQDLPPVRSKIKKDKPVQVKKKPEKRIAASDYTAWDKFDVDKACEEVDMAEVGPASLDGKQSSGAKLAKLREEAQYEKEKGNKFVKAEKWDEAIKCYNRAIELVKDDPIYYANRGLCYLKKDSLHQAEMDCTEALRLDPTYVKALQRRATAREHLGSLRAAASDLREVLRLEPHNKPARIQLEAIKNRMGTKGAKSKSSPSSTPTGEGKPLFKSSGAKIVELPDEPKPSEPKLPTVEPKLPTVEPKLPTVEPKLPTLDEQWRNGLGENVTVIKTVKKPPHLRSKRALKPVTIQEIPLGKSSPEKPPTRLKIIEVEDDKAQGDSNNNESNDILDEVRNVAKGDGDIGSKENKDLLEKSLEEKIVTDSLVSEKFFGVESVTPPTNSVQFLAEWKLREGHPKARADYLSIIDPAKFATIFSNSLESNIMSEILATLAGNPDRFRGKTVAAYLKGLSQVKRFSTLVMFLSNNDKQLLTKLLTHCKAAEHCSDEDIADLKNKYEL